MYMYYWVNYTALIFQLRGNSSPQLTAPFTIAESNVPVLVIFGML